MQKLIIIALCSGISVAALLIVKLLNDFIAWVKATRQRWFSINGLEAKNRRLGEELIDLKAEIGILKANLNRANTSGYWIASCNADEQRAEIERLKRDLENAKRTITTLKKQIERNGKK